MTRRCFAFALALLVICTLAPLAQAEKSTPLNAQMIPHGMPYGVYDDGNPSYNNGQGGISVHFGVNNTTVVLFTYNTSRKMHFRFDPTDPTFQEAQKSNPALLSEFDANVDFDGINFYGAYYGNTRKTMPVNSWTTVHLYLQFYVGNITYELDYPQAAVIRSQDGNSWVVTTQNFGENLPISPAASLSEIRRRSQKTFTGTVNMPIQVLFTLP